MFTKSRKVVALGVAGVLATAGIAIAGGTGAEANTAAVDGKVTPAKLPARKFVPIDLFTGVRNSSSQIDGSQSNPASERISYSKNIKVDLGNAPRCTAPLPNGIPTAQARDACPPKSYLGGGEAEVVAPGGSVVAEPVVSVFNGPGRNELRLHTYDPGLGVASPVVNAKIINSPVAGYGKALNVPEAPATGAIMITKFNSHLLKARKVVKAKCKPRKFKYQRRVVYDDASSETVTKTQRCKVRR